MVMLPASNAGTRDRGGRESPLHPDELGHGLVPGIVIPAVVMITPPISQNKVVMSGKAGDLRDN